MPLIAQEHAFRARDAPHDRIGGMLDEGRTFAACNQHRECRQRVVGT
jgi:hypothetical protein